MVERGKWRLTITLLNVSQSIFHHITQAAMAETSKGQQLGHGFREDNFQFQSYSPLDHKTEESINVPASNHILNGWDERRQYKRKAKGVSYNWYNFKWDTETKGEYTSLWTISDTWGFFFCVCSSPFISSWILNSVWQEMTVVLSSGRFVRWHQCGVAACVETVRIRRRRMSVVRADRKEHCHRQRMARSDPTHAMHDDSSGHTVTKFQARRVVQYVHTQNSRRAVSS